MLQKSGRHKFMKAVKEDEMHESYHFTSCKQYNKMIIDETTENKHDTNFPKPITPHTFLLGSWQILS